MRKLWIIVMSRHAHVHWHCFLIFQLAKIQTSLMSVANVNCPLQQKIKNTMPCQFFEITHTLLTTGQDKTESADGDYNSNWSLLSSSSPSSSKTLTHSYHLVSIVWRKRKRNSRAFDKSLLLDLTGISVLVDLHVL